MPACVGNCQDCDPRACSCLCWRLCYRDVSEKRKGRKGDSGLTGPVDIPEVLLEKLGFPRKIQFQKVRAAGLWCWSSLTQRLPPTSWQMAPVHG